MKKLKFIFTLWVGKFLMHFSNIFAKGRGTNMPGAKANMIMPDFIGHFTGIDYEKVIFITGTNGKSTANNMVVHTLRSSGKKVCSNLEGANMIGGIATALIRDSSIFGKVKCEYFSFEIDERSLERIYSFIPSKNVCVTNLQKDQVQRNGEPDYIVSKFRKVFNSNMRLFLNNGEPRAKSFEDFSSDVIYYGVGENKYTFKKDRFFDVTMPCPKCNDKIFFDFYNVDNVGHFHCAGCSFKSEENAEFYAENIDFDECSFDCAGNRYIVTNNEPFYIYNYALCIAVCSTLGITFDEIQKAFYTFINISGRMETLKYKTKVLKYIRIKQENPETLQTALDYIAKDKEPKIMLMGLEELRDFHPYYTNTFYSFDVDFESLKDNNIKRYICFSEAVAYDTANRMIYAGIDRDMISIIPNDNDEDILKELNKYDIDNVYLITWLKKYNELDKSTKIYGGNENE